MIISFSMVSRFYSIDTIITNDRFGVLWGTFFVLD